MGTQPEVSDTFLDTLRRVTRLRSAKPMISRTGTALCWLVPGVGLLSGPGLAEEFTRFGHNSNLRWLLFLPALALMLVTSRLLGWGRTAIVAGGLILLGGFFFWGELARALELLQANQELCLILLLPALAWALLVPLLYGLNGNRLAYSWAYGIPERQLAEHFAVVPGMGSHLAHLVRAAWRSTFLRYALPSLLLMTNAAFGATTYLGPTALWWFLVPSMLAAYCAQPLLIGASWRTRSWGFLTVALPLILVVVLMTSMKSWDTFWHPGAVVIILGCHGGFLRLLVGHLRRHEAEWEIRLQGLCHGEE